MPMAASLKPWKKIVFTTRELNRFLCKADRLSRCSLSQKTTRKTWTKISDDRTHWRALRGCRHLMALSPPGRKPCQSQTHCGPEWQTSKTRWNLEFTTKVQHEGKEARTHQEKRALSTSNSCTPRFPRLPIRVFPRPKKQKKVQKKGKTHHVAVTRRNSRGEKHSASPTSISYAAPRRPPLPSPCSRTAFAHQTKPTTSTSNPPTQAPTYLHSQQRTPPRPLSLATTIAQLLLPSNVDRKPRNEKRVGPVFTSLPSSAAGAATETAMERHWDYAEGAPRVILDPLPDNNLQNQGSGCSGVELVV